MGSVRPGSASGLPGLLPLAAGLLLCACQGSGDIGERVSGHIVGVDGQGLGPGLVLVERGPVHAGSYVQGTRIDESGRWSVDLWQGPGTYGLHLFSDWNGYQYLPVEIEVTQDQQITLTNMQVAWGVWSDRTGQSSWPTQPDDTTLTQMPQDEDRSDNPLMHEVSIGYLEDDLVQVVMDVSDPTSDLSRMQLAYNTATGAGMALNPPEPPDSQGNYPQGTYTATAYLDLDCEDDGVCDVPGQSLWYFIVADNMCNDTDVVPLVLPERP